ncbi:MAG: hypothetical protein IJ236_08130 [Oscillospiraceae bacterium]|nr:hypothetical protein [Oscillospiraceae bacterium]
MDGAQSTAAQAVFPMQHPEMQIGNPPQTYPEVTADMEYARDTRTWD